MDDRIAWLSASSALLVLAAWSLVQLWLARRFKRRFNVGGGRRRLVVLRHPARRPDRLGWSGSAGQRHRRRRLRRGQGARQARIDGNDAKSNESLTLIARGSGAAFEEAWQASADAVDGRPARLDASATWTQCGSAYAAVHTQIRELDDGGSWDAGGGVATGTDRTRQHDFTAFDDAVATRSTGQPASTVDGLPMSAPGCRRRRPRSSWRGWSRRCSPMGHRPAAEGVPMSDGAGARPASRCTAAGRACCARLAGRCGELAATPLPPPSTAAPTPRRRPRAATAPATMRNAARLLRAQRRCRRPATCRPARRCPDPGARPPDRRRLGRHLPARVPQPVQRQDRGLRHRHGQGGGQGDLRRREQVRAQGDHRRPADPRAAGRRRSTSSPAT